MFKLISSIIFLHQNLFTETFLNLRFSDVPLNLNGCFVNLLYLVQLLYGATYKEKTSSYCCVFQDTLLLFSGRYDLHTDIFSAGHAP